MKVICETNQGRNINIAFERLGKAIALYLNICYHNQSPVKSLSVEGSNSGWHVRTTVRYHAKRAAQHEPAS
jgi:hypothetical protein